MYVCVVNKSIYEIDNLENISILFKIFKNTNRSFFLLNPLKFYELII